MKTRAGVAALALLLGGCGPWAGEGGEPSKVDQMGPATSPYKAGNRHSTAEHGGEHGKRHNERDHATQGIGKATGGTVGGSYTSTNSTGRGGDERGGAQNVATDERKAKEQQQKQGQPQH